MKIYKVLFIVIALLAFNLQFAQEQVQEEESLSLDGGPIISQFEYLTSNSGNYNANGIRYEVVKLIHIDKLRQNVLDSLKVYNKKAAELNATIAKSEVTINMLNKKLEETSNNLVAVNEEKDSISFLGIMIAKGTYNFLLWTIITGLLLMLIFFIYKFRESNILTQEAKSGLSELEMEYEDHRRRALEREQKISRQLQDELNKHKKTK
ncbi:tRNA (guanine-N1)-methyltransferase [Flavobacteriaceae bacterium KMM 6897]|nr:tRNA (guanine-N1)-methyltransferase [Flavobacteriaceae bacterium KMM 6897]MEB8345714.1 tRNA (guanine-N1)-methyltransferase [Flavobacteriaceae bacterium KMM 6898]